MADNLIGSLTMIRNMKEDTVPMITDKTIAFGAFTAAFGISSTWIGDTTISARLSSVTTSDFWLTRCVTAS